VLDLGKRNFDWKVKLEGSQKQEDWFTILEDYRILSINNEQVDFQFTRLEFPAVKFRFFRLFIPGKVKPELKAASLTMEEEMAAKYVDFVPRHFSVVEKKNPRQTEIYIGFDSPVPVSYLKINIQDTLDFYRPVTIQYLQDSFKTEKGWKAHYGTLGSGTVNSIDRFGFMLDQQIAQQLKITINHLDNEPLSVQSCEVKGYRYELVARFSGPGDYYLVYGNPNVGMPVYDIAHFIEKIPEDVPPVTLEDEEERLRAALPVQEPLFKNKFWLWGIMIVVIGMLGFFSLKMIKKNSP